jgi:hypothetical protein
MAVIFVDEAQTDPIYISTTKRNRGSALWLRAAHAKTAARSNVALQLERDMMDGCYRRFGRRRGGTRRALPVQF